MPNASAKTGTVVCTRQPPHESATSPGWSATHAAPAAASAISNRKRMIRYIETLLRRPVGLGRRLLRLDRLIRLRRLVWLRYLVWLRCPGKRRHRFAGEMVGGGKRHVALVGLVEPCLRRGAIGRRKRIQLAPRIGKIISQRSRRDAGNHSVAVVADSIGSFDANELCSARLQAIHDSGAGRFSLLRRRRQLRHQRRQFAGQTGGARNAGG